MSLHNRWYLKNPVVLQMRFTLAEDGWIVGEFPAIIGCRAHGKSLDEAVFNLTRVIQSALESVVKGKGGDVEPVSY